MAGFLAAFGEMAVGFVNHVLKLNDGSYVTVATDKASYSAGELVTGKVVAQINSPVRCDKVIIKVACKEKVHWDAEHSEQVQEGSSENPTFRTVWHHHQHTSKDKIFKDLIVASTVNHTLPPGRWEYPFSYQLRADLPGCLKFKKMQESNDPHWRDHKRGLETSASVVYTFKAVLDANGIFSRDLKSRNEIVVNSFFDWNAMKPQHSDAAGEVMLLCCIPRGRVTLACDFDKAAYAVGDTAQIKAVIQNDSKSDVGHMVVKLMRFVELTSDKGERTTLTGTVLQTSYPGVPAKSKAERDLPLAFRGKAGDLLPSTKSRRVTVHYRFDVECDIAWAPDIEAHLPVVLYQPAPAVWGMGAVSPGPQPVSPMPMPQMMPPIPTAPMPMPPMPMPPMPMPPMPMGGNMVVTNPMQAAPSPMGGAVGFNVGMAGGMPPGMPGGMPPGMTGTVTVQQSSVTTQNGAVTSASASASAYAM